MSISISHSPEWDRDGGRALAAETKYKRLSTIIKILYALTGQANWSFRLSSKTRSGGPKPLVHLMVIYHAGLLCHQATTRENCKVRESANPGGSRQRRMFLGIHFQHHSFPRHLRRSAGHFRSSHAAGSTPVRPEIDKHGNGDIVDDFIEQNFVNRQGLGERRQRRFTVSATTGTGQIFCRDTVFLAAMTAGTDYRQESPPSYESMPLFAARGIFRSLHQSQRRRRSKQTL